MKTNHLQPERDGQVRWSDLFGVNAIINRSDFASSIRLARGQSTEKPNGQNITVGQGTDGGVNTLDSINKCPTLRCKAHGAQVLHVAVLFDETSLAHPVKKLIETLKVVLRLILIGCHTLHSTPNLRLGDKS